MKRTLSLLFILFFMINIFANVNHIDIDKISNDTKYVTAFRYIKDNQEFYDHWSIEWNYLKRKQELINNLRDIHKTFSEITNKNTEVYLLLGDISHYLYNLEDTIYYDEAVKNYNQATKMNPKDYRGYWFLGYHLALSNHLPEAFEYFLKAQEILPHDEPADFWNDYAWLTGVTNMPSHCMFAMDKVKSILGYEGKFESQFGQTIRDRIEPVDKNKTYKSQDIWTATEGEKITFMSRPLGIKLLIDSTWDLSIYDYENQHNFFIINPPPLKNKNGKVINYTVGIFMKVANEDDVLEDFLNTFITSNQTKKKTSFSKKYDNIIAYELFDKTSYEDIGGAHLYLVGIERNSPKYPGLLLESPINFSNEDSGQIKYYVASNSIDRFNGKIFYVFMLDSCEDINEQSLTIFKQLFNNQIIIE